MKPRVASALLGAVDDVEGFLELLLVPLVPLVLLAPLAW